MPRVARPCVQAVRIAENDYRAYLECAALYSALAPLFPDLDGRRRIIAVELERWLSLECPDIAEDTSNQEFALREALEAAHSKFESALMNTSDEAALLGVLGAEVVILVKQWMSLVSGTVAFTDYETMWHGSSQKGLESWFFARAGGALSGPDLTSARAHREKRFESFKKVLGPTRYEQLRQEVEEIDG